MGNQNSAKKVSHSPKYPSTEERMERQTDRLLVEDGKRDSDEEREQDWEQVFPCNQNDMPFCIKDHIRPLTAARPANDADDRVQESMQVVLTHQHELTLQEDDRPDNPVEEKPRVIEIAFALGDDISKEEHPLAQAALPPAEKRYFSAKAKTVEEDWNFSHEQPDPKPQTSSGQGLGSQKSQLALKAQLQADWEPTSKEGVPMYPKQESRSAAQTRDSRSMTVKESLDLVTSAIKSKSWSQTLYSTHELVMKPSLIFEFLGGTSKSTIFKDEDFKHNVSNLVGHQRCRVDKDKKKL